MDDDERGGIDRRTPTSLEAAIQELRDEVKEIKGWLLGTTTHDGRPVPGLISAVATFRAWRTWVLALLGAITVASATNAVSNIMSNAAIVQHASEIHR